VRERIAKIKNTPVKIINKILMLSFTYDPIPLATAAIK
jgi:hypothetical protein